MEVIMSGIGKQKFLRYTFVVVAVLIACVIALSLFKRYKTELRSNEFGGTSGFQTNVIYGDIKIKTIEDVWSYDAISESSKNNGVTEYLQKNIKKGDTIINVSHGVGIQTLLMAKLATKSGRIYVYNPCKRYVDAIMESAKANEFESRILAFPLGISDRTFNGLLVYKNNSSITDGKIETADYQVPAGYSAMAVDVSSIDEQLPNLQNINMLRININSDCSNIIRGAKNLINKSPNIAIVCDFDIGNYTDLSVFKELINQGFKIREIHKDGHFLKFISVEELSEIKNGYLLIQR